jgi:hypothetical protein
MTSSLLRLGTRSAPAREGARFSRSLVRSDKILLQNGAILRNTLRMLNRQTPSVGNAVQSSETMRNSLGVNYKSAALNQLSYVGEKERLNVTRVTTLKRKR